MTISERLSGIDFLPPGHALAIGFEDSPGRPRSAFERLFLLCGDSASRVRTWKDMVGHVRLESDETALHYVRLFTSPAIARALDKPRWLEIVPASGVDDQFVYGRSEYLRQLRAVSTQGPYRAFGVLSDKEWRRTKLVGPLVERTQEGFVVTRYLFVVDEDRDWQSSVVYRVAESLSRDGRLHRRILDEFRLQGLVLVVWPEE